MSTLSRQDKCHYLANVMAIAQADGVVSLEESQVFQDIAMRLQAGASDMAEARRRMEGEEFQFVLPEDPLARLANFEDMIMMALADGRLHHHESRLLEDLAGALRFSQADVNLAKHRAQDRLFRLLATPPPAPPPIPGVAGTVASRPPAERRKTARNDQPRSAEKKSPAPVRREEPARRRPRPVDTPAPMIAAPWQTEPRVEPAPPPAPSPMPSTPAAPPPVPAAATPEAPAEPPPEPVSAETPASPGPDAAPVPAETPALSVLELCMQARAAATDPEAYCFGRHVAEPNLWGCRLAEMPMTAGADWLACGQFRDERTFAFDRTEIRRLLEKRLEIAAGCPHLHKHHIRRALAAFPERAVAGPYWTYRPAADPDAGMAVVTREYIHGCPVTRRLKAVCLDPVGDGAARRILRDATRKT